MKQQECFKYAYIAGVLDSDGSMFISRDRTKKGTASYKLNVKIAQKQRKVVDYVQGIMGGRAVAARSQLSGSGKEIIMYDWHVVCDRALNVLKKVYPFLRGKKDQAEICIRFQERMIKQKRNNQGQYNKVPQYEMERREREYLLLKDLKKNPNCADVETEWKDFSKREEATVHPSRNRNLENQM